MNYYLIRTIPFLIIGILLVVTGFRAIVGKVNFHGLTTMLILLIVLAMLWLYITWDEQVFMHNINLIAEVFKHRLETITNVEVLLLIILGAILFKKMS